MIMMIPTFSITNIDELPAEKGKYKYPRIRFKIKGFNEIFVKREETGLNVVYQVVRRLLRQKPNYKIDINTIREKIYYGFYPGKIFKTKNHRSPESQNITYKIDSATGDLSYLHPLHVSDDEMNLEDWLSEVIYIENMLHHGSLEGYKRIMKFLHDIMTIDPRKKITELKLKSTQSYRRYQDFITWVLVPEIIYNGLEVDIDEVKRIVSILESYHLCITDCGCLLALRENEDDIDSDTYAPDDIVFDNLYDDEEVDDDDEDVDDDDEDENNEDCIVNEEIGRDDEESSCDKRPIIVDYCPRPAALSNISSIMRELSYSTNPHIHQSFEYEININTAIAHLCVISKLTAVDHPVDIFAPLSELLTNLDDEKALLNQLTSLVDIRRK